MDHAFPQGQKAPPGRPPKDSSENSRFGWRRLDEMSRRACSLGRHGSAAGQASPRSCARSCAKQDATEGRGPLGRRHGHARRAGGAGPVPAVDRAPAWSSPAKATGAQGVTVAAAAAVNRWARAAASPRIEGGPMR